MSTSAPRSSGLRGVPTFGFAAVGLLVGHSLSYLVAVPDPDHRDVILGATGHGYLPGATQLAVVLMLAGVATLVARAWSEGGALPTARFRRVAATLAAIQVGAFLGQEVLERLVVGTPLGDLAHDLVVPAGIGVQVAVALVGAALLRWLAHASARAVVALGGRSISVSRPTIAVVPAHSERPRVAVAARRPGVRGPPSA